MRTAKRVSACALLVLSASAAQAADRGFYFGASAGQAKYDFDQQVPTAVLVTGFIQPPVVGTLNPSVPLNPFPLSNGGTFFVSAEPVTWVREEDDESTAWSLTAGYRFNRYLGVEASYVNLGKLEATDTLVIPLLFGGGTTSFGFHRELETDGPALTAFGTLPLSESWALYVRAGILFANTELTTSFNGTSNSTSFDSEAATVGAGVQFDWGANWSARLQFQRALDVGGDEIAGDADVDEVSLAVLYRL